MIRTWRFAFIAATAIASAAAHGQERAAATQPDLAKAQQIVTQICAACHGADGNSVAPANPNLAGQGADYITLQLAHFKAGVRVNATMQAMSATLSDADMRALGAYYAQQKPKGLAAKDPTLVKTAQQLWRGGDAANGTLFTNASDALKNPDSKAAVDALTARNIPAEAFTLNAYAAVEVIAAGIEKAKSAEDSQAVADALKTGEPISTAIGKVTYGETGDMTSQSFSLYKWEAGKIVPAELARGI